MRRRKPPGGNAAQDAMPQNQTPPLSSTPINAEGAAVRRTDTLWAWGLGAAALLVYGLTACRTIYTGDDGDFLTAMATGGVPHPTGYPLFCLLGRALLALPLGPGVSPPFRVNLMTAFFGAVSVAFLFRFIALVLGPSRRWAAALTALFLAWSPTLWQQSLSCEVYTLACAFLAALLFLAARLRETGGSAGVLRALAFTYGLGLTNHLTLALFLPGFVAFAVYCRPRVFREPGLLASLVGLFVLPLGLYAYLPWAASHNPPVSWGNPYNWANFKAHVTGETFRDRMFSGPEVASRQSALYISALISEWGLPLLALGAAGIIAGLRQRSRRALTLLALFVACADITYAINYDVFDIAVYFLPSYFAGAFFAALGLDAVADWGAGVWARRGETVTSNRGALAARTGIALCCCAPLLSLVTNYQACDKSANFLEDDFSANILRSAPPNAIVVLSSNATFTLWYHRFVLHERPDVTPIYAGMARGALLYDAWYFRHLYKMYPAIAQTYPSGQITEAQVGRGEFLRDVLLRAARRGVPVLIVPDPRYNDRPIGGVYPSFDALLAPQTVRVPWGVCERLYLKNAAPPAPVLARENAALWNAFVLRGLPGDPNALPIMDPAQAHLLRRYAEASQGAGEWAERTGDRAFAARAFRRAADWYDLPEAHAALARLSAPPVATTSLEAAP